MPKTKARFSSDARLRRRRTCRKRRCARSTREIRRIIDEQYAIARKLIEENRDKIEAMVKALIDWETIDTEQIDDIVAGTPPRPPKSTGSVPPAGGKSARGGIEGVAQPA